MGLFDSRAGGVMNAAVAGGVHSGLAGEVLTLIGGGQGGGLARLVRAFEGHGLGSIAQSWISTGRNLPVSPDQIAAVLGSAPIAQLGARFGLAPEDVASHLAQLLPKIVDALTPLGSIPDSDALQEGLSLLRQRLG